jgi:hypothetical protein
VRIGAILVGCFVLTGAAHADPVTLLCTGSLTLEGTETKIARETAILDLENHSFKPPLYPAFPLTRIGETDLSFGNENSNYSTWGSLDRISGTLSMNVMRPSDRKKLLAGETSKFLAWMSAKCAPLNGCFRLA